MSEINPEETPHIPEVAELEQNEVQSYIDENIKKIQTKTAIRKLNLNCQRPPSDEYFFKLDSSLKKNTAFVKKLKQFTASQLDVLLKDMKGLNLTKYISEVSSAIVEVKLKMSDVHAVIELASQLHRIYVDFSQTLLESWQKCLSVKSGDKINASKMRVDLRLFAELISAGIFTNKVGLPLLGQTLTGLISQDKEEHSNLSIVLTFCKHCGEEYAGLVPRRIQELTKKHNMQLPQSNLLPADKQQNLRNLLRDYYQTLCRHLKAEHRDLQAAEKSKRKQLESKGEISNEKREHLEMLHNNFDKLLNSAQTLSDLLNEPLPELPRETELPTEGIVLENSEESGEVQLDPWGDEETKNFYVELPDLRQFLPNYCAPKENLAPEVPQITEEVLDKEEVDGLDTEDVDDPPSVEADVPEPVEEAAAATTPTHSVQSHTIHDKKYLENFLANLHDCVNKELIDSAAIDFLLNCNTKNNRKKLMKALFNVQRTRLDLFPLYSRLVAIINLVAPDVAVELGQMLKIDFKYHVKKRDQINIESKIKTVRFIGELVKFGLYPKLEALFCLKILLHNFQHHHIEMTCAFLEVCGQYLYNSKESRMRINVYLEQMMRLKTANALDNRHTAQIENCYYLVKPPEGMGKIQQKIRPPIHLYIRHLVFEELNKTNVDKMIKLMRRLNWEDKEIGAYAIKCLSKAYNIRYHSIRYLADLVSGLSSYQEKAIVKVIDTVFEDIRAGLEIHSPKLAQRRVAMAKYLGELYNYRLVDSTNILNTLYSIISLGVSPSHDVISEADPPDSLFRLKISCVLLDTCGQYFTSSASKKRLDYFLIFFQHYYWFKKSDEMFTQKTPHDAFPILTDNMYKECITNVRPKLKLFKSYEAAQEAVEKLQKQLYPDLMKLMEAENTPGDDSLKTIREENGDDESEHGETFTEDNTSEAIYESDDDGKPRNKNEDEDDDNAENLREISPTENEPRVPVVPEKTQEDLDFEQAFEKLTTESYQERMKESIKPNTYDIPVPMTLRAGKKTYDQLQDKTTPAETTEASVPFVLMCRSGKGGKQQFKTFQAPCNSQLAVNLKLQEQKIKEENEKVKRLTLNITERIEEEAYQESLLNQRADALNRPRVPKQQKFKHQKGVPDADLIFN